MHEKKTNTRCYIREIVNDKLSVTKASGHSGLPIFRLSPHLAIRESPLGPLERNTTIC